MRSLFLALYLAFALSAPLAHAGDHDTGQPQRVEAERASPSVDTSSEAARAGQHYKAAARTGLMYTLVPGVGVEGDVLLSSRLQVGASVNTGRLNARAEADGGRDTANSDDKDDDDDDKTNLDIADLRATSVGGHVRFFPSIVFMSSAAWSYRTVKTRMQISDATNETNFIYNTSDSRSVPKMSGIATSGLGRRASSSAANGTTWPCTTLKARPK